MESKDTGADKGAEYQRRLAEKQAKFDAIKKWISDNNIQPLTREEFDQHIANLVARRRKYLEEQNRNASDKQTPSDNAA